MQQRNREIFIIIIKYANYCDLRMMKTGQSHCGKMASRTSKQIELSRVSKSDTKSKCVKYVCVIYVAHRVVSDGLLIYFMWKKSTMMVMALALALSMAQRDNLNIYIQTHTHNMHSLTRPRWHGKT